MAIEVIQVTEEDITVTLTDVGIRGRAGLVFRGDYNDTTQYYQGDSVRFSNNLYIATGTPELGTDPTDSEGNENTGWELLIFGSPSQAAIVDFHVQTSSGSIVFAEGDLIRGLNDNYYWTLGSGTLSSSTILTNESNFEVRGNPVNTVGTGTIANRPASADEVGDFYVTDDGDSSIWDGTQWLGVHTKIATTTDDGLMSAVDKVKLDGIEALAEANDKVTVDFSGQTITINSTEDAGVATDTATIPLATKDVQGIVRVDTDTLSVNSGIVSADETLELGKLKDVTAPTVGEDGFVLRGQNSGSSVTYNWIDNNIDSETIQSWDATGNTNYDDNTGSLGSSIVEYEDRLYMANAVVNYETTGSCSVNGIINRTQCTDGVNNGIWTITTPDNDSNWNEIGPGNLENLDDVDVVSPETSWTNTDQPILSRVGTEWKLFPGLDKLSNIGDIPIPNSNDEGSVLTYDSTATPQFAWRNSIARIQDFDVNESYTNGELVRSNDKIWLVVSTNVITASTTLPSDGEEWQSVGPENLAELNDTVISADVLRGDLLTYNGINWVNLAASQGIALSLSLTDIGDVPGNSILNKVLVSSENSAALAFVPNSTYNKDDIATFGANYFKFVGADGTTVGTETPDNDTTNWAVTTSEVYTWEDYARNIKNVQPYSSTTAYLGDDLVQYQGSIYISLNSASATVDAPTGVDTDTNWNQLGASTLTHINDVPDASVTGSVLSFAGEVDGKDTYAWTTTIAASASVDPWDNTGGYSAGALVTHTVDGDLSIFLNILSVSANSNGNTAPEGDPNHWEIIGPEKITNLEDVSITNEDTNDLLQYNGNKWVDKTPAQVAATMELAEISRVANPVDGTDDNKVLQVIFSGTPKTAEYTWVDRTTNTTTIQGHSTTKTYTAGELVFSDSAIYLAIGTATNLNKTPGTTGGEAFWQLIGPETFEQLEDSAIASPSTDQFIIYNSTTSKWINTDLVTETEKLVDLLDLKDVDKSSALSSNDVLRYNTNNSTWEPVTPASLAGNMNLGELLDVGVAANVSVGDFIQRVASGNFEGVDSSEVAAQIDAGELKDVTLSSLANDDIVQRKGGVWVNRTPDEVSDDLSLDNLGNVGTVNDNEFLQKNGSSYDGKTISELLVQGTIDNLDDVTLGTLGDNEILQRKSGDWVNSSPATVAGNMLLQNVGDVSDAVEPGSVPDNPGGGKTAILMYNTDNSKWEAKIPGDIVAKTSLETIRNVAGSIPTGSILQKGISGIHEAKLPFEIGEQLKLGDLNDVVSPGTTEDGFVLKGLSRATTLSSAISAGDFGSITVSSTSGFSSAGKVELPDRDVFNYTSKTDTTFVNSTTDQTLKAHADGVSVSQVLYEWVDNNIETASIQEWDTNVTYSIGDLVEYKESGEELKIYIARISTTGVAPAGVTNSEASWELLGPERIDSLNDVTLTSVSFNNVLRRNTANDGWENVTPAIIAEAGIDLNDLKDVDGINAALGNIIVGGGSTWTDLSLGGNGGAVGLFVELNDLKGIDSPLSSQDGFVLRGNNDGTDVSYDWVSNVQDTATIQGYSTLKTYSIGHLVTHDGTVYLAKAASSPNDNDPNTDPTAVEPGSAGSESTWEVVGPESINGLVGVTITGGTVTDLLVRTGTDTWKNTSPAEMAASGIDLSDLKDVNGDPASGNITLGDGDSWESISLPIAAELHINLSNLKDVSGSSANGHILVGTGSSWDATTLSTATNNAVTGVDLRSLKNVDDSVPGTDEVLQFTGTEYESKDTDTLLTTGHLASIGDVDSSPDLSSGASSDLGKVLTVRKDSNDNANYVWEAASQTSIQAFKAGTTTDISSYKVGDLVFVNDSDGQKIWIAQQAFTSSGGALTPPPGTSDTEGVSQWNLIGPEDISNLEDVTLTNVAEGEILRYDNDSETWKNVSFIDSTGLTGDDLNVQFTSGDSGIVAKVDATGYVKGSDFDATTSARNGNNLSVKFSETTNTDGEVTSVSGTVNVSDIHSTTTADGRFLHEDSNWDGNVAYTTNDIVTSAGALFRAVQNSSTAYIDSSTTYQPNDVVSNAGTLWRFNESSAGTAGEPGVDSKWVDFTETENPEDDSNSSDWIKFMQTGDEGIPIWRDTVTYVVTDLVEFGGNIYRAGSPAPTIGEDPAEDTTGWIRLGVTTLSDQSGTDDDSKFVIRVSDSFGTTSDLTIPAAIETKAGVMSADDKVQINDLPDTWITGTTYNLGDQVSLNRKVYISLVVSNVGNNPTSGVDNWIPVGDGSRFLNEDSNWDGNVAYTTNDIVTSNGALFRTVQNSASAYNSATTYLENNVVSFDGTLWRFNNATSGTAGNPGTDSDWVDFTKTIRPENDSNSSEWIKFMQTGDEGIPIWRDNIQYVATNLVEFGGDIYRAGSPAPDEGDDPSEDTANWIDITPTFDSTDSNNGDTLAVNFLDNRGVIKATVDASGIEDIRKYVIGTAYSTDDVIWEGGEIYRLTADITSASNTAFSDLTTTKFSATVATESVSGIMSAEDKVQINDLPDTFDNTSGYSASDQVSLNRKIYTALLTQSAPTPPAVLTSPATDTTNWSSSGGSTVTLSNQSGGSDTQFVIRAANSGASDSDLIIPAASASAAGVMTVSQRNQLVGLPNEWSSTVAYFQGSNVAFDKIIYESLHGTNLGNTPSNAASSSWIRLSDSGIHFWRAASNYLSGTFVVDNGVIYRSNSSVPPNESAPGSNSKWVSLLDSASNLPEFITGTGGSGIVGSGVRVDGITNHAYVKLYFPLVPAASNHRATDVTFSSGTFNLDGASGLGAGSDNQVDIRFVNNNAASAYNSVGFKDNSSDKNKFIEFWYPNYLTTSTRTVRQFADEIVDGNNAHLHNSTTNTGAIWDIEGTVDEEDHEKLVLKKSGVDFSINTFTDFNGTLQPLGIEYENIAATTSDRYTPRAGISYVIGDLVRFHSEAYMCFVAYTTAATQDTAPDLNTTNWKKITM